MLNPNYHNLKDLILINNMKNVINEPTRQQAILDPIIITEYLPFLSRVHVHNLHPAPGSKFTPGCKFAPPHMPINCVHTHLDSIRNLTQGTHFYEKFAVFECSN